MVKEISNGLFNLMNLMRHDVPAYDNPVLIGERANPRDMACESLISQLAPKVERIYSGDPFYHEKFDIIGMYDIARFRSPWLYYSVMFHEMAHWTGHKSRICRNLGNRYASCAKEKHTEEVAAEIASFTLAVKFGFDDKILMKSARYLQKQDKADFKRGVENGLKALKYLASE